MDAAKEALQVSVLPHMIIFVSKLWDGGSTGTACLPSSQGRGKFKDLILRNLKLPPLKRTEMFDSRIFYLLS